MVRKLLLIAVIEILLSLILFKLSLIPLAASLKIDAFLRALADAVFIAAILTGTFELVSRNISLAEFRKARELMQRQVVETLEHSRVSMTEQIVKVLFHSQQPSVVLQAIEKQVISQPIVRDDFEYTVHLEHIQDKPNYLKLTTINRYRVSSLSKQEVTITIPASMTIENEIQFPDSTRIEHVRANYVGETGSIHDYGGPGIRRDDAMTYTAENIPIPPDKKVKVEVQVSTVRLVNDKELFIVTVPTLDSEISIHPPRDIEVRVESIHPTVDPVEVPSLGLERRWEVPTVLLPGQGVVVIWRQKIHGQGTTLEETVAKAES